MSLKQAGVESIRTGPFNPNDKNGLSFKEHDMKFLGGKGEGDPPVGMFLSCDSHLMKYR